nr:hypothetical protein [Limosilactobacillus mucosae]
MDDYEKARAVVLDKNNSFAELSKWSGMSIPRLKQFRADPEKLKTAKWIAVHKLAEMYREVNVDMNFDMKNFIKVHDDEHSEGGWAKILPDGNVILDNNFEYYKAGQQLILKDDHHTIDNKATDNLRRQKIAAEEIAAKKIQAEKDAIGAQMIGKTITTKHGQGEVIAYDGARVIVDYGNFTRAMPITFFMKD